jgi:hypothetical protein
MFVTIKKKWARAMHCAWTFLFLRGIHAVVGAKFAVIHLHPGGR